MSFKLKRIIPSPNKLKKYRAVFINLKTKKEKTTDFGQKGANDFTITGDEEAKKRYLKRHAKDLATKDPTRAGYLAIFILWNKKTLKSSILDYKKRFNL
tara:strand:+ start:270 stop:566 length:297 start_codon:yes stop_codon:yes gene_type:complete